MRVVPVSYTHLDVYKRQPLPLFIYRYFIYLSTVDYYDLFRILYLSKLSTLLLLKQNVAGKLPLLLNRSSPKSTDLESSTICKKLFEFAGVIIRHRQNSTHRHLSKNDFSLCFEGSTIRISPHGTLIIR